jgi:2-hydroxy-3-keto-5-methylthiopentenyl-1-phosphate phosphatase
VLARFRCAVARAGARSGSIRYPGTASPPVGCLSRMFILCDFDDTTATQNVAVLLLERFHPGGWRAAADRFRRGEISLAEYQEQAFEGVRAPQEQQAAHVQEAAALRPGFVELAAHCEREGIGLGVVSHGLDYYIRALLDQNGLAHVGVQAAERVPDSGAYRYRWADPACGWYPGNCKCSAVRAQRQAGHAVLYAGDGASDACPAREADFVFARDALLSVCRAEGIPHRELTDFHVVLDYLRTAPTEAHS